MTRGRNARTPRDIPVTGWKDVALRLKTKLGSEQLNLVSAGVAFYALLAIFPGITALVALAGLVLSPANVAEQMEAATRLIPDEAAGDDLVANGRGDLRGEVLSIVGINFHLSDI